MPPEDHLKPIHVLGVPITPFRSYAEACARVGAAVATREKALCVAINPEKIYVAQSDRALWEILDRAEIRICDGVGAAIAARVLHGRKIARITGISLFYELVAEAERQGWKVFLLGAAPEVNELAAARLRADYPRLRVAGRLDGYFKDADEALARINAAAPDLLFVAMGSPRQEYWIAERRDKIDAPFCMGVGGTFDVLSGRVKWAPAFFRKTGTEWLFRLLSDPKRWRRQMAYPKFTWMVLKRKLTGNPG